MPTIDYTYTILEVNDRSMTVEYTHPTHGPMQVGVRRPKVGETLEAVIDEFSPVIWWLEQSAEFAPVQVGVAGAGATVLPEAPAPLTPEEELALWRQSAVCSAFQFRYTLQAWGLMAQVQQIVAQVGEPLVTAFEYAIEVRRLSPSILSVFGMLTMPGGGAPTEADLDRFWTEAMAVEV